MFSAEYALTARTSPCFTAVYCPSRQPILFLILRQSIRLPWPNYAADRSSTKSLAVVLELIVHQFRTKANLFALTTVKGEERKVLSFLLQTDC